MPLSHAFIFSIPYLCIFIYLFYGWVRHNGAYHARSHESVDKAILSFLSLVRAHQAHKGYCDALEYREYIHQRRSVRKNDRDQEYQHISPVIINAFLSLSAKKNKLSYWGKKSLLYRLEKEKAIALPPMSNHALMEHILIAKRSTPA